MARPARSAPLPLAAAALAVVAALACRGPAPGTLDDAALYGRYCARCHGEDGRGDPRSVGLNPGLDLTRGPLVLARSHQQIYQRIAFGYGAMPAFSHKLEVRDLERLTKYSMQFAEAR